MLSCLLFGFGFSDDAADNLTGGEGGVWQRGSGPSVLHQLFLGQDAVDIFLCDTEWVQEIINIFKKNPKLTKQRLQLYSDLSFICLFFVTFPLFCIFTFPVFIFSLNPHLPCHYHNGVFVFCFLTGSVCRKCTNRCFMSTFPFIALVNFF